MDEVSKQDPLEFKRDPEFASLYANNVHFESTLWDLKLTFGQVDLASRTVDQHTAMALPWPQAKIAAYYLLVNLIFHETQNGRIFIPQNVLPKRADVTDPTIEPNGINTVTYLAWLHDQFFGPNPYTPPASPKNSE